MNNLWYKNIQLGDVKSVNLDLNDTNPDILIPANTPSKTQLIVNITSFTPTGSKIGDHVIARLKRVAAVGTAPTNNCWIPMLQMHVLCDTDGSRNILSK